MRRSSRLVVVGLLCAALAGCTAAPDVSAEPSASATLSTTTPTTATTPTPEPTIAAPTITVTLDAIEVTRGAETTETALADGDSVVALLTDLSAAAPIETEIEDPWGQGDVIGIRYEWADATVSVFDTRASLIVRAPRIGDAAVSTEEGIAVGSPRTAVVVAGGWDVWDQDGDGVADQLGIAAREAPGTSSLSRPGEVGHDFIAVTMTDDAVSSIHIPANDYADI